jgi:Terminase RNaseH-like domain/Terminase large subunit, T4likevirus-type, N-terminal
MAMNTLLDREALFQDLGYKPHPGQWDVHRSTASRRVLACGVRYGKSRCAAMEAVAAALEPAKHSIGWVVAPTYDLADRVFREIQVVALERLRHRVVMTRESDRRIVLLNMAGGHSEIRAKSADNPVSLLGEGLDWLVADEAARLKRDIWESHLTQRLLDKNGWALLISTPKGSGYFHELFRRGQGGDKHFKSWNQPSWTNPFLDKALIDAERDRLPERVFRQEFGAEFVEGSGQVFRNVRECATGNFEGPKQDTTYVAGLDLARVEDYTVLVIVEKATRRVVFVDRFHRVDWSVQLARIQAAVERYNHAKITCDVTGVGDPIYEALRSAGCHMEAYPFTQRSKAALIDAMMILLERKAIVLPKPELWPDGIEELESFQYSVSDRGTVRTEAPSGMHDDCAIATCLAYWPLRMRQEHKAGWTRLY